MPEPLRVVIGEDDVLLREGISRLWLRPGSMWSRRLATRRIFCARASCSPPSGPYRRRQHAAIARRRRPASCELRCAGSGRRWAFWCCRSTARSRSAADLIGERAEGVGYLLKERVGDVESFIDAVQRVAGGGTALDPEVVARMLGRRQRDQPVDRLSPRELDVLAAMAEGKSNRGIAQALLISQAAVEKHVTSIFHKLALEPVQTEHRRVLAVLAYLRDSPRV